MKSPKPIVRIGELALFSIGIGAVNLFFRENPGFFRGPFNPYLLLALIAASYYGKYFGLLSLLLSCLIILLPLPLAFDLLKPGSWALPYWLELKELATVPLAVNLVAVYILGLIRDSRAAQLARVKERLRLFSRQKGELLKRNRVTDTVNRELEERISGQRDSVTALHSEIEKLYSLNLQRALDTTLSTVQRFSGATRASIWQMRPDTRNLHLVASLGWEEGTPRSTVVSLENTLEGWVLRNNSVFSLKLLGQYENLRKMDRGLNIMTFPVSVGRKVWGVLNIEDMPFVKYNLYAEKLVAMILALAAPALERAVEYEAVVTQAQTHPVTGLPAFAQFYSLLQNTLKRMRLEKGTLSVLIVELSNFDALVEQFDRDSVLGLISNIAGELVILSRNKANLFHYKEEKQIAMLYPNLDYDGASLFSLETLSRINEREWKLQERAVAPEVTLGYASLSDEQVDADGILQIAENILEMQKV